MELPKISIITVSYNAGKTIEETIKSVIQQTYSNIEYIIIDGGSTDETIDIIKKYSDKISYWISEPDKGVYDAMNKGAIVANGAYLQYLNASDILYKETTISDIVSEINNKKIVADIIYGDMIIIKRFGTFHMIPSPLCKFDSYFPFYHPSSWVKRELFINVKFDTKFKIAADYNFFRQLYYGKYKFCYLPIVFTIFEGIYGISSTLHYNSWLEKQIINQKKPSSYKMIFMKYKMQTNKFIKFYLYKIINVFSPNLRNQLAIRRFLKDKRVKQMIY